MSSKHHPRCAGPQITVCLDDAPGCCEAGSEDCLRVGRRRTGETTTPKKLSAKITRKVLKFDHTATATNTQPPKAIATSGTAPMSISGPANVVARARKKRNAAVEHSGILPSTWMSLPGNAHAS